MQTPWGELGSLDISERGQAEAILCADKHQLLEGMVVECLFDQFLENLPSHLPGVLALDVETVIAKPAKDSGRTIAVVWVRKKTDGLGRYLYALETRCQVFLVEYTSSEGFYGAEFAGGRRISAVMPLDELLRPVATTGHTPFHVSNSVRDENRQSAPIWGFLFQHSKEKLVDNFILPRLLINCGVQPWFSRGVWNLDRIFIIDGEPWLFEVKHKFPFGKQTYKFGLNVGELDVIALLADCGVKTLHTIMVKPKWSKTIGSMYMLNDLRARDRTAVIGQVIDRNMIARIRNRSSGFSKSDTTITGEEGSTVEYKPLFATEFGMFGVFSDKPAEIAGRIVDEIGGAWAPRLTAEELLALRLPV